ncbi:hypothetical protein EJ08DRAFT_314761 [Tothia fuscella]|uniref:Uncharacterized protein n=1 Tax=Tothia fuscella TaxID=1048955 RepID=A0A9P4TXI5_9PEZI|nr:hypothetical protein EJ08DRAFT_314761 [Tothia fuscella]
MSYPTKPTYIASCAGKGFDAVQDHPCMVWMHKYTLAYDAGEINESTWKDWSTDDMTYYKTNGEAFTGAKAIAVALEVYAPFSAYKHEPNGIVACWETANGWEMVGQAMLFVDFPVAGGEKMQKDLSGKAWDVATPSMFAFEYVKDESAKHDGIKMKSQKIFADTALAMLEMLKRGMVKPEMLMA